MESSTLAPVAIIAHRGSSGEAPENTLAAFRRAIEQGAAGVEFDVQASSDGIPVVIHDEFLDRTTSGSGPVGEQSLEQLKKHDAGSWLGESFREERIPTLEEVLALLKPTNLTINLEFKTSRFAYPGLVPEVLDLIERMALEERVILSSFNHLTLTEAQARAPQMQYAAILYGHPLEAWDYAVRHRFGALHPEKYACNIAFVSGCHDRGIAVRPWTVNDRPTAERLFSLGVDGIITNVPGEMMQWQREWRESIGAS